MNPGVRIIKRDRANDLQTSLLRPDENTGQQSQREIASTIKNWISDLAQRRRADELTARTRFLAATHS